MTVANIQQFGAFACGICSTYPYLHVRDARLRVALKSPPAGLYLVKRLSSWVEWLIRVRVYGVSIQHLAQHATVRSGRGGASAPFVAARAIFRRTELPASDAQ